MKKRFSATTFAFTMAFTTLIAIVIYSSSCKREPVFVGSLSPDPVDTTGGGDTTTTVVHPCDADSIYFSLQVQPILTSNCAMSGCHDAASHQEGVIYDTYANTRNTGKISISNPAGSKLYKSITATNGDRMPPAPASPLTAEQKAILLKWMQQGAQNLTCDAACDTTNVTYQGSVWPVIQNHCTGCHSGGNPSGGVAYTTYAQVKTSVSNGKLMGSINHSAGVKPMPYPIGNAKLDNCSIRKIQIWIDNGAPNN